MDIFLLEIPDILGGGGNLSSQVIFGGTEQMMGPSLCSRKMSRVHSLGLSSFTFNVFEYARFRITSLSFHKELGLS